MTDATANTTIVSLTKPIPPNLTPMEASFMSIKHTAMSLPYDANSLAIDKGKEFIKLRNLLDLYEATLLRLKREGYISKSARCNFKLTCSERLRDTPKFQALKADSQTLISKFQTDCMAMIINTTELEIEALQQTIVRHLCDSIYTMAMVAVLHTPSPGPRPEDMSVPAHILAKSTLYSLTEFLLDLNHSDEQIFELYKTSTNDTAQRYRQGSFSNEEVQSIKHLKTPLLTVAKKLFVESWEIHNECKLRKETELRINSYIKQSQLSQTTAAVAMDVDTHALVDTTKIESLIERHCKEATRSLEKEIHRLKTVVRNRREGSAKFSLKPKPGNRKRSTKKS